MQRGVWSSWLWDRCIEKDLAEHGSVSISDDFSARATGQAIKRKLVQERLYGEQSEHERMLIYNPRFVADVVEGCKVQITGDSPIQVRGSPVKIIGWPTMIRESGWLVADKLHPS